MKTDNVVKSLRSFGIKAAAYKRTPGGRDMFALTILPRSKEGVVTINQGTANVEIFGSRAHKQAVITVRERGRKLTRKVSAIMPVTDISPSADAQQERLKSNFPVVMPSNTVWTVKDMTCVKRSVKGYGDTKNQIWYIKGNVTARVIRRTENNFLIGMDETHNFVAPLPKKVTSVKEAHRVLRPKVKRGSLRQGEWFFEPVTDKKLLRELNVHTNWIKQGQFNLGKTTHSVVTHVNLWHRRKGDRIGARHLYVRGDVMDRREGHHKTLFLTGWHRVVRNKEGRLRFSAAQRSAAALRQRAWD